MFKDDKIWTLYKYWRDCKPEEELYIRLKDNPYWPFKQIGDGYFYVVFRSDRVSYAIWIMIFTLLSCTIFLTVLLSPFPLAMGFFFIVFVFGCWTIHGKIAWRELIISRRGKGKYMIRIFQNEEILFQSDIRNVYIRLVRKYDALGDPYFCLMLGGFQMDDHRITRMTKAETPLRIMGMRIAYRVGLNFFDWKDESEEHLIWHYKSYSKLKYKTQAGVQHNNNKQFMGETSPDSFSSSRSFLSVPHIGSRQNIGNVKDKPNRASEDGQDDDDDDSNQKRKVRINKLVKTKLQNKISRDLNKVLIEIRF